VIEFDVTSDGTRVAALSTGQVNQGCTPPAHLFGGGLREGFAAVSADGSFKIDIDYRTTVGEDPATAHFTLTGQFAGSTATGTLQANVSFTHNGTGYACGSGLQTWNASRTG
jgi:hypothetical protein